MKRAAKTFLLISIVLFCSSMLIFLKPAKILDFLSLNIQNISEAFSPTGEPWFRIPSETTPTQEADSLKPVEVSPTNEPPVQTITLTPSSKSILDLLKIATIPVENAQAQIPDVLDCSAYLGWLIHHGLNLEEEEDYIWSTTTIDTNFVNCGFGESLTSTEIHPHWQAGDILSIEEHVWMVVGMCEDESVLILHSSPYEIAFYGTTLADGSKSQSISLAEDVMKTYYPEWYTQHPVCDKPYSYLTSSTVMRWNRETLTDAENLSNLHAKEILSKIFE